MLRWPDARAVEASLRAWVPRAVTNHSEVCRIGYFGSYARGDWGVGSDVDLIVVVERSDVPFERRASGWDTSALPVPADILVYTDAEWQAMDRDGRFPDRIARETIWLYERHDPPS